MDDIRVYSFMITSWTWLVRGRMREVVSRQRSCRVTAIPTVTVDCDLDKIYVQSAWCND